MEGGEQADAEENDLRHRLPSHNGSPDQVKVDIAPITPMAAEHAPLLGCADNLTASTPWAQSDLWLSGYAQNDSDGDLVNCPLACG
jgi:hypothetical protein